MTTITTGRTRPGTPVGRLLALLGVLLLAVAALVALGPVPAAQAASRVDVTPAPSANGDTTVTLHGSGFQYQPNAPGGVYVFFGTVADPATNAWTPSQGGKSGSTFTYDGTTSLLISFKGGGEEDVANGVIEADGTWTAQMTIHGSTFTSSFGNPHEGEQQSGSQIDCLQVSCGIITIGAHGMINANNESYTPVGLVTSSGSVVTGSQLPSFDDEATVVEVPGATDESAAMPTAEPSASASASASASPSALAAQDSASSGISGVTWAVLGVLVVAVLVLLVAVVVFFRRRRPPVAAALSGDDEKEKR